MATLFYFIFVLFTSVRFNLLWVFISIGFSLVESGGRVIYRYTLDHTLAGYEEEL